MSMMPRGKWSDMGQQAPREVITNLLLGLYPGARRLITEELARQAARGFFHAVALAIRLAKDTGKMVLITYMREGMSGVAVLAGWPGDGVQVCRVDLGIPMECNEEEVVEAWPDSGKVDILVVGV